MTCGYFVHNFICVLIKWHKDDFHIEQRTSNWSTFFFAYIFAHFIYAYISLCPNHCNSFQFGIEFFFIIAFSTWDFSCVFFLLFSAGKQLNLTSSCHISWIITSFHGFCILSPISSLNWCESGCHISNGNGLPQMLRQTVYGWMEKYRNNLPEGDNHKNNNNNNNRISIESKLWFRWLVDVDNFLNTNEFRRHYFAWNFPTPNFYDFSIRQSNMCVLLRCSRIEILEIQIAIEIPSEWCKMSS